MKNLISYLDDLKEKCGSDYKIAKLLKTNQSTIGMIRSRNQCGEETAIKIADLLGVTREEVLIAAAIARSNSEEAKHAWENISKLSGIAASVVFACSLMAYSGDSSAATIEQVIHYAN
jgi:plasmid maintenance system antidote protein VapI